MLGNMQIIMCFQLSFHCFDLGRSLQRGRCRASPWPTSASEKNTPINLSVRTFPSQSQQGTVYCIYLSHGKPWNFTENTKTGWQDDVLHLSARGPQGPQGGPQGGRLGTLGAPPKTPKCARGSWASPPWCSTCPLSWAFCIKPVVSRCWPPCSMSCTACVCLWRWPQCSRTFQLQSQGWVLHGGKPSEMKSEAVSLISEANMAIEELLRGHWIARAFLRSCLLGGHRTEKRARQTARPCLQLGKW